MKKETAEYIATAGLNGTVEEFVDCRENLCKVLLSHNGEGALEEFIEKGADAEIPWSNSADRYALSSPQPDGLWKTEIYHARKDDRRGLTEAENSAVDAAEAQL